MLQCWHEITFCHWSCDPALLRSHVPPQLQVDTFEGKAWISLTPFLLTGLRPPLFAQARNGIPGNEFANLCHRSQRSSNLVLLTGCCAITTCHRSSRRFWPSLFLGRYERGNPYWRERVFERSARPRQGG